MKPDRKTILPDELVFTTTPFALLFIIWHYKLILKVYSIFTRYSRNFLSEVYIGNLKIKSLKHKTLSFKHFCLCQPVKCWPEGKNTICECFDIGILIQFSQIL